MNGVLLTALTLLGQTQCPNGQCQVYYSQAQGQPAQTVQYYYYPTQAATPQPVQYYQQGQPAQATYQPTQYTQPTAQPVQGGCDPYGFLTWLNSTRAAYGLGAVGYDENLSNWAAMNNNHQAARGMGHFVMGPARRQNAAMGAYQNIGSMWMNSPAHRAALLDPTIRAIGIAGLGAYWTFNAY